jgi:hypothetical protein
LLARANIDRKGYALVNRQDVSPRHDVDGEEPTLFQISNPLAIARDRTPRSCGSAPLGVHVDSCGILSQHGKCCCNSDDGDCRDSHRRDFGPSKRIRFSLVSNFNHPLVVLSYVRHTYYVKAGSRALVSPAGERVRPTCVRMGPLWNVTNANDYVLLVSSTPNAPPVFPDSVTQIISSSMTGSPWDRSESQCQMSRAKVEDDRHRNRPGCQCCRETGRPSRLIEAEPRIFPCRALREPHRRSSPGFSQLRSDLRT